MNNGTLTAALLVLAIGSSGCEGGSTSATEERATTTASQSPSLRPVRATNDNAPCRRLEFAGQTYGPSPVQTGIGVGGMLTTTGEYATEPQSTPNARGLDCGNEAETPVQVYSVMEQPTKDAVSLSGTDFGIAAVWEYVNTRLID